MYAFYSQLDEQKVEAVEKEADFSISPEKILSAAKACQAKAIYFSNPCNPTGWGMNREEVRTLIRGTDALVVLDEAYMDFWDQGLVTEAADYDNVICLKTCSKAFGLAALRLGFAVANPVITKALRAVKSPYNVNSVTQVAAAAILEEKEYLQGCMKELVEQKDALYRELEILNRRLDCPMVLYPSCTNFVFLEVKNAPLVHQRLLKRGIAVRCMKQRLRISAPAPEELKILLKALKEILQEEGEG